MNNKELPLLTNQEYSSILTSGAKVVPLSQTKEQSISLFKERERRRIARSGWDRYPSMQDWLSKKLQTNEINTER